MIGAPNLPIQNPKLITQNPPTPRPVLTETKGRRPLTEPTTQLGAVMQHCVILRCRRL